MINGYDVWTYPNSRRATGRDVTTFVFDAAGWTAPRSIGSCYLNLPPFLYAADARNAGLQALGELPAKTSTDGPDLLLPPSTNSGDVEIDGPGSTQHVSCAASSSSFLIPTDCNEDAVITASWFGNFQAITLLIVGAMVAVVAELAISLLRGDSA